MFLICLFLPETSHKHSAGMDLMLAICKLKPYLTVLYVLSITFFCHFVVCSKVTVKITDIVLLTLHWTTWEELRTDDQVRKGAQGLKVWAKKRNLSIIIVVHLGDKIVFMEVVWNYL